METYRDRPLPGRGYADICDLLELPSDAPVGAVMDAMNTLKLKAQKAKMKLVKHADYAGHSDVNHVD